ncbi:MAG: hypothetical protein ACHREM_23165 [Polyangiales bacterium]
MQLIIDTVAGSLVAVGDYAKAALTRCPDNEIAHGRGAPTVLDGERGR